jgi:hypothetical protein
MNKNYIVIGLGLALAAYFFFGKNEADELLGFNELGTDEIFDDFDDSDDVEGLASLEITKGISEEMSKGLDYEEARDRALKNINSNPCWYQE